MSSPNWFRREGLALLTDFYELAMMAGYLKEGRAHQEVTFNYFFRTLPPDAGFAVAAGLAPFLDYVENLKFLKDDLDYLREQKIFDQTFLDHLKDFRTSCTIQAVPEGSIVFPHEPIVQVSGTIFETQLLETALLNFLNYQTLIATKAARICLAADGDPVMEFGLRRAHGPDGGVSGSRAAYIGGCSSTSNVLAGKIYDIPVSGTQAHSWVMSFPNELAAFRAFARNYPQRCVLLVDTYDTLTSGVPNAIRVFKEMLAQGLNIRPAIRLDSGDLAKLSKAAYKMMTDAGLENPLIVASSDLEEDLIADLKRQGARINSWGVGTHLITARDNPSLNGVYKLVAVREGRKWVPRIKISSNLAKSTDPGRKKLMRYFNEEGQPIGDIMCMDNEKPANHGTIIGRQRLHPYLYARLQDAVRATSLLDTVLKNGKRTTPDATVQEVRRYALEQIAALPEEFKRLRNPEIYRVALSEEIGKMKADMLQNPDVEYV